MFFAPANDALNVTVAVSTTFSPVASVDAAPLIVHCALPSVSAAPGFSGPSHAVFASLRSQSWLASA